MQNLLIKLLFISLLTITQCAFAVSELPQTGQTNSETKADDGELKLGTAWPSPRFTDNQDGTLTDNLTGLMWIKDSFCANNFISGAATANWVESIAFATVLNEHSLATPCNEYTAKYEDWRAPNVNELASLIRAGLKNDTNISDWLYIPEDQSGAFSEIGIVATPIWSSTTVAANPDQAWTINLKTGEISPKDKISLSELAFIFSAVRSTTDPFYFASGQSTQYIENDDGHLQKGIASPKPRFITTDFGTVIDKLTGLMWLQDANCAKPDGSNWITASNSIHQGLVTTPFFSNCPNYTPTIIDDKDETWRFPNINELRSLINYGETDPALDKDHPFNIVTDKMFWTSTSANNTPQTAAWTLSLESGKIFPATEKTENAYTWPVRGPVEFPDINVSHSELRFNSLFVNAENNDQTIQIQNTGKTSLSIELIQLTDENDQPIQNHFSIGRDLCSERNLEADTNCSLVINFAPKFAADLQAKIKIRSNALGISELSIPVFGTGLKATSTDKSNPKCFIATAAYGSFLAPEVKVLRNFRDNTLLQYDWGKQLVMYYYELSPPLASFLAKHETLRIITRALLAPLVYGIKHHKITFYLLLLIFLAALIYRFNQASSKLQKYMLNIKMQ